MYQKAIRKQMISPEGAWGARPLARKTPREPYPLARKTPGNLTTSPVPECSIEKGSGPAALGAGSGGRVRRRGGGGSAAATGALSAGAS